MKKRGLTLIIVELRKGLNVKQQKVRVSFAKTAGHS
jgi:hypothetical protein